MSLCDMRGHGASIFLSQRFRLPENLSKRRQSCPVPNPHFDLQIINRAGPKGAGAKRFASDHSAVAAAAYLGRACYRDERQGRWHDYRRSPGRVIDEAVLLPAGAPERFRSPSVLWNAVEAQEKRKDSQVARRIIMGLPHELGPGERSALLRNYLRATFVDRGMIAHYAIHAPHEGQDQRHTHAHVLLTMRRTNRTGFWSTKTLAWNDRKNADLWRAAWAGHQNKAFARAGLDIRVDLRTLKAQRAAALQRGDLGAAVLRDRTPEIPVGKQDWMTGRGLDAENRAIIAGNAAHMERLARGFRELAAASKAAERFDPGARHALEGSNVQSLKTGLTVDRLLGLLSPDTRAVLSPYDLGNFARTADKKWRPPLVTAYDIAKVFSGRDAHLTFIEQIQLAMNFSQAMSEKLLERDFSLRLRLLQELNRPIYRRAGKRATRQHEKERARERDRARARLKVWSHRRR